MSKAKHSLTPMAKEEVCPRDEIADPLGMAVLPIDILYGFDEGLVSFRTLCGVQSSLVRFDRFGSATVAGIVRDSVFKPCVLLS